MNFLPGFVPYHYDTADQTTAVIPRMLNGLRQTSHEVQVKNVMVMVYESGGGAVT